MGEKNTVPSTPIFSYVTTSLSLRQKQLLSEKEIENHCIRPSKDSLDPQRTEVTWKTSFKKNQCNLGDDIIQQTKLLSDRIHKHT